jgi:hypothetical protein
MAARSPKSGEAGHQGRDRQPTKEETTHTQSDPDQQQAARPAEVHARSKQAPANKPASTSTRAPARPGPDRPNYEKNKGNAGNKQKNATQSLQKKIKPL